MLDDKVKQRFWDKVDIRGENECWEWTASRDKDGYGQFRLKGKTPKAHRIAYCLANGLELEQIEGMKVRHYVCDNEPCQNHAHLRLGSHWDNMQDRNRKGRQAYGERHGLAKIPDAEIPVILERLANKETQQAIAKDYGVKQPQISRIKTGKQRKHN